MSIDVNIFNEVGNKLSDPMCYRRINHYVLACFNGINLKSLGRMAFIAFEAIIRNKFYGDKAQETSRKDIDETRRIYNDISLTMTDILLEWDHSKYINQKEASMVVSNMNKTIRSLDDLNIFYCWKYEGLYMFVIERDFRIWKYYNSKGCLIPKTLKKIIVIGHDMISCMEKNAKKAYNKLDKSRIEASFGDFLNRMIDKMNPMVTSEIAKWDGNQEVGEYMVQLSEKIKDIEDYRGLEFADDIFMKLPYSVSEKLRKKLDEATTMKKRKETKEETTSDVEKNIIPENPNIAKPRRQRIAQNLASKKDNSDKIERYDFSNDVDPFKNVPNFIEYYRAWLQIHHKSISIRFESFAGDTIYAAQIMDMLRENNRSDIVFLVGWIKYFYDYRLKGNKMYKSKYTSLKAFMETFGEYNARHVMS
jgi:hypothetical protein